jgi:thiamine biosynthesis lipoprotein
MFQIYKKAYSATNGLVTPLIGDVLISLGYDAKYSLEKKSLVAAVPLEEIVVWFKPVLYIKQPTMLDFGACGKGYLVDIVSEIIEKEGIRKFIVDGSGDMKVFGEEIKVGLEHPEDKQSVIGTILLKDKSLCGSSGNRRKWADVHHIVNPNTGVSPKNILSVWVVAESTILADILTTCLFFVSAESLKKDFNFDYLILKDDYSVEFSGGINAEIFEE